MTNFISVDDLAQQLNGPNPPRVLDVRYRLDQPDGRPAYRDGHIPTAVYVDMDTELADLGVADAGRHPLPSHETLQAAAQRWGLSDGDSVVVYDDWQGIAAARAWWLLRQAGVAVRVLDGGWSAWTSADMPVETGDTSPATGTITLHEGRPDALTIDEAADWPNNGVLIDVRAPERYRGDVEPLDPIAGHIPGAVNLPTTTHLEVGRLRDAATLRENFERVGVTDDTPVAAYCGSGVTAAHTALVLAELGITAKVFPGSWSQWSNTPGRPVATGE